MKKYFNFEEAVHLYVKKQIEHLVDEMVGDQEIQDVSIDLSTDCLNERHRDCFYEDCICGCHG